MTLGEMSETDDDARRHEKEPCPVLLKPYAHQVGGHSCLMLYNKNTICKPLKTKEYDFYLQMPDVLKPFTPEYKGKIPITVGPFLEMSARYAILEVPFIMNITRYDGSQGLEIVKSVMDNMSNFHVVLEKCVTFTTQEGITEVFIERVSSGYLNCYVFPNTCYSSKDALQRRKEELHRHHLDPFQHCCGDSLCSIHKWRDAGQGLGESHTCDACSLRVPADVSNPWTKEVMRRLWKRIPCESHIVETFILLENVTNNYQRPCILDLKMGIRQHSEDANQEKIDKRNKRVQISTSGTLGARLCGMKIYNPEEKSYIFVDKYKGRVMDQSELKNSLKQFFNQNTTLRVRLIQNCLSKLVTLSTCLKNLEGYRFYSSSLLLMYDACAMDSFVDVRIIDFANISFIDSSSGVRGHDEGLVFGLENLMYLLEDLCEEFQREGEEAL